MKFKTIIVAICSVFLLIGCDASKINQLESEKMQLETTIQKLNEDISELQSEIDDLNKQISDLSVENRNLKNEVSSLNNETKEEVEDSPIIENNENSINESTEEINSSSSTNNYIDDNPNGVYNQESVQLKESYKNCTLLREVYPEGVPEGHPAYELKHDRDKDGWACEK